MKLRILFSLLAFSLILLVSCDKEPYVKRSLYSPETITNLKAGDTVFVDKPFDMVSPIVVLANYPKLGVIKVTGTRVIEARVRLFETQTTPDISITDTIYYRHEKFLSPTVKQPNRW
jgi:hypothetical protein